MTIISFKIPKTRKDTYHFQVDRLNHFYDKLHKHPEVQVTFIEKSSGTLIAGDYIGKFSPGDVFIIGSSLPHVFRNELSYYTRGKHQKTAGFSLYIDMEVWKENFWADKESKPLALFFKKCHAAYKVSGGLKDDLAKALKQMEQLRGFERMLFMLNTLFLVYKSRRDLEVLSDKGNWGEITENEGRRMARVIQFTLDECDRSISLKEVAEVANLTVEAFCRYFKAHTRKTYVTFLNEIRINNACQLLTTEELTKSEIAWQCGFNNLSYFNRTFKKITGKSPGEYEKLVK